MAQEEPNKVEVIAGRSGIIVEARAKLRTKLRWRLFVLSVCVVTLAAIAVVLTLFSQRDHRHQVAVAKQSQLQQGQSDVNALGDMSKLQSDSNQLIQGSKSGDYTLSDKQLAQAYANRGDGEFNDGNEKAAVADYEQAVKLDGGQQVLVGYNEFVARYHQGERKALIPLLQALAKSLQNDHEQGAHQLYAQYESYISDLQAGKDLSL
jgi:hypothetical protein